jgi:monoterpene epsilon-lactone hydrolase
MKVVQMIDRLGALAVAAILGLSLTLGVKAASAEVTTQGAVTINGLKVPLSDRTSPEAQAYVRHILVDRPFAGGPSATADIDGYRRRQDEIMETFLKPIRARYAVNVEERRIGGVLTDIVTPAKGVAPGNAQRVLLNIHGGGFISGARTAALVESIPIAATMGVKVVSIDYRMSPEAKFPAASEDIAAVYAEMLKTYKPSQIGIYGCSAGGMLAGQSIGWFQANNLPRPGAIGVLCASLGKLVSGDSAYLAGPLNGFPAPPASTDGRPRVGMTFAYLGEVADNDPRAYPEVSPQLLASFPPTLLITGTRSMELSAATYSHNQLVKAKVDARLHVWDGLFHAFLYNSNLPESREAYDVIADFFDKTLSR